ncbi:MAG: reverse transcriptase domain-containing protein [Pseudomonadota bacterium]
MALDQPAQFSKERLSSLYFEKITRSKAVGLDGTRVEHFTKILQDEIDIIERKVYSSTYRFTSYREKLILKGAARLPRKISIPTVRDRLTLRALCDCLSLIVPDAKSVPPHNYIKSIAALIKGSTEPLSFLRVDVRDFFPTIKHDLLVMTLQEYGCESFLIDLVRAAVSNNTGFRTHSAANVMGIPQGLSISNILSSIFMIEFDRRQQSKGIYHRYVDDILVVAPSHLITKRYIDIHSELTKIGLTPHAMGSAGKTEIKRISDGIDYLGYHLTPSLISVRKSSYHRMFANLNKVFTLYKYKRNINQFIFKLNLRITGCILDGKRKGWLMFFSQTDNLSQLAFLDEFVRRECRRLKVPPEFEIARFVKAFHEIRYKGGSSEYIPNFDNCTLEEQYNFLSMASGISREELDTRSVEGIEAEFKAAIAKEVADLEQDVIQAVS